MNAHSILTRARAAGISIAWDPPDRLRVIGPDNARAKFLPLIREHKPEILALVAEGQKPEPSTPRVTQATWWERVLGNSAKSIATLDARQRWEAQALGLLPEDLNRPDLVVFGYRNHGAQGLMTAPAATWDGLKALRIFEGGEA